MYRNGGQLCLKSQNFLDGVSEVGMYLCMSLYSYPILQGFTQNYYYISVLKEIKLGFEK